MSDVTIKVLLIVSFSFIFKTL